jgi:hypothetical protein
LPEDFAHLDAFVEVAAPRDQPHFVDARVQRAPKPVGVALEEHRGPLRAVLVLEALSAAVAGEQHRAPRIELQGFEQQRIGARGPQHQRCERGEREYRTGVAAEGGHL